MQSLSPLTISDLLSRGTQPLLKIELYPPDITPPFLAYNTYGSKKYGEGIYGGAWISIADLSGIGGDILKELSLSFKGSAVDSTPIAATWSIGVFDKDALFHLANPDSGFTDIFNVGQKFRLYIGIKVSGTDYWWLQMIGVIAAPLVRGGLLNFNVSGYDLTQLLIDTKLRSPDNYFGAISTFDTVANQYEYNMPLDCKGAYIAFWDGTQIYNGNDWTYDSDANQFVFNPDKTIVAGTDNLVVHYYTQQIPENVIADLLVAAGIYSNQATALDKMEFTATGKTIDRVWFNTGNSVLHSIKLICELCNYRFYFKYDGTPIFKPKPSAKAVGSEDLSLTSNQHDNYDNYEDDSELFNRIAIEGEEQAAPVWKEDAESNKLRGESFDQDSIDLVGEKTLPIKNHLFQDQSTIDAMTATLLSENKDQKKYISFDLKFSPIPLEIWDTVRIQSRLTPGSGSGGLYSQFKYGMNKKYGDNGLIVAQRGLVRDIKINRFSNTIILEEVT